MALNAHKASGGGVTKSGNEEDMSNGVAGTGGRRATMTTTTTATTTTTTTLGGSAVALMKSSRSSYTWLDRLRYLKGFDEGIALSESQSDDAEDSWLWRSSSGVLMKSSGGGGGKECDEDENTTISASSYDGRGGGRRRRMIEEEDDDEQHMESVGRGGANTLEPRAVWELYFGGDVMRVDNDSSRSRASLPLATAARNNSNNNNNNNNNKVSSQKTRRLCLLPKSSAGQESGYSIISRGLLLAQSAAEEASSPLAAEAEAEDDDDDEELLLQEEECERGGVLQLSSRNHRSTQEELLLHEAASDLGLEAETLYSAHHDDDGAESPRMAVVSPECSTRSISVDPSPPVDEQRSVTAAAGGGFASSQQLKRETRLRTTWTTWAGSKAGRRDHRPVTTKSSIAARNKRQPNNSDLLATQGAEEIQEDIKLEDCQTFSQKCTQQRSCTKWRRSSAEADLSSGNHSSQASPVLELAPDHPSKKPPESLVFITYKVFLQAGKGGLTAREAASRIEDAGLGRVFQGVTKPRIKIGKIIRNNPYYLQAGEGRYILCEAIVGVTRTVASPQPQLPSAEAKPQDAPLPTLADVKREAAAVARRKGTAKYWAEMHANGWTRGSKGRHKQLGLRKHRMPQNDDEPTCTETGEPGKVEVDGHVQADQKSQRLKGLGLKNAMGGKACKRSDGKNWQCPLLASADSNYCDHHQKRLKQAAEAQRAFRLPGGSRYSNDELQRSSPSKKLVRKRVHNPEDNPDMLTDINTPRVGDKRPKDLWAVRKSFNYQSSYDGRSLWGASNFSTSRRVTQHTSCGGDIAPAGSSQPSTEVEVR